MPATPARIGFITEEFRRATSLSSGAATKYGEKARRSDLIETFFEDADDAQAMADERLALLSADRRRFSHVVSGVSTGLDLDYTETTPTVTVIDDQRLADHEALVSEIIIDFEKDQTTLETWG